MIEKKKGKKKELIVLILLLLVLCSGVVTVVVLFNQKNNDKVSSEDTDTKKPVDKIETSTVSLNQYTVIVKSDTGVVLPNVLVSIYDAEGNMITQPEATDAVGRLLYTSEAQGTFGACVMAAPHQYALDREIHYFESGENLLSIVLEEDPTAYVAKIGDMNYTLRDAITAANASSEDVTITLLHDVYIVSDTYLNNKSGKTITIDGGGKKVTYLANSTLFSITQKSGTVHFKNMTISHNGEGAAFRTSNAINLNLTDVTILAQNDTEGFYKWSLINLFGAGKTNLTMTRVKIDMDISTIEKDAAGAAVIRTGNEGNVKDINITMNNCDIDATGAKGRAGIRVTPDTTANVVFNNTKFLTQNNYVVAVEGQLTWSQTNSTLGSKDKYYNEHPVPDVIATVGNTKFYSLNTAAKQASKLGGKEPVKLIGDITLFNSTTFSGDGITAIIDGNGHTITTEGGNTIFKINANNYKLTFKNMTINHGGYERLLQYEANKEGIDVVWENVTVVASGTTEDACYKFGLMNLRGSGSFTMKSSSITLDVPKIINGSAPGVIRTGNANDGQKLTISLDNSKIDVSKTNGAYGIYVQKSAATDIVLKNYEIHTNNRYPVYVHADDGDTTLTYDNMDTWSCKNGSVNFLCNLTSLMNMKDAAKIGNTVYRTLPEAFKAAQEAGGDVTITLLRDCKLLARTDFKTEHSSITIDGDGKYSLSTAGSALIFVLDNDNVSLTLKDLVVDHKGYDRLVTFNKKSEGVYTGVNIVFDNVTMTASGTNADKCYPYGVFNLRASGAFTMIDSTITVVSEKVFGGDGYSVIRLGNANDGQTVNITMNNSTIVASETENIAGINVSNGATAEIKTLNSAIKTKNKHAIHVNSKGKLNFVPVNTEWSYGDAITNCAARIDNDYYVGLTDAWSVARTSETPTTITLLKNCTANSKFAELTTANANVTIDGDNKKYTLTTTANGANIFTFGANNVSLTFKDLVIEHKGNDRFVTCNKTNTVTYSGINLVLDNVTMTASGTTSDKCYQYGVFNIRANGNVELIDSTITLTVPTTTGGADCGVIRLGNSGDGTSVDITITNSTIDASNTKKIAGIYVNGGVTADIELSDATIRTKERYAINVNATGSLKLKESNTTWSYGDAITNCAARIGNDYYVGLTDAWNVARTNTTPITITLLKNCTVSSNFETLSTANANITIDGDNKKYTLTTTENGVNIFTFGANNVSLTFKDLLIEHKGNDRFVTCNKTNTVTYSGINLVLDNVTMTASGTTSDKCYQYGVFNIRANGNVELIDSTITLTVPTTTGGADCGVFRLGNSGDGTSVDITITNSTIDASNTKKIAGIYVNGSVTADVELTDSTIKTNNRYAINVNSTGTLTLKESNAQWSCTDQSAGINSITNLAVKIGKDCYKSFEDAWKAALAKDTATTITLLNDVTVTTQLPTISKDGTDLTIDGQNKKYTLTAALTADDKNVIDIGLSGTEKKANLTLQNMKITHKTQRALVGVGKNAKSSAQLNVNNVEITVDYADTSYYLQYGVFNMRGSATLIMTDVTITVTSSKTGTDRGIIRIGNNDDGATVYARLQNCTLDTKQATDVAIARVNRGNTLDISCQNCDFETANAYVFNINSTGGTFTARVDKYTEANSVAGGKTQLYNEGVQYEVVENLAQTSTGASINGFLYADAKTAFDDAQLLDGYVTIKLLKDNSWPTPANVSMNTQYVDLTIDGQGQYKLTTGTKNMKCSAFYIENDNISLTLKDMDIHHMSQRAIVVVKQRKNADGEAIGTGINISLENVNITTEAFDGTTQHDSGLINIRNNAYLYMKDVNIDYKNSVPTGRNASYQVIRFGNKSSDDGTKTVTAVLEKCEVNVNDGHSTAFFAHTGTTVNLTAEDCEFKNFKQNLIYRAEDSNLTFAWDNSTWNGKTGTNSELVHYTTCKEGYNCTITGASD